MYSRVFENGKGRHTWSERTICEVHREIYDLLVLDRTSDILPKLEEAYLMGIKLVSKLVEYKLSLPEWEKNDSEKAKELRQLRIELNAMVS